MINRTKLVLPTLRAGAVARPRIDALLDRSVTRPITLVQAAPGYGKTTSVAGWLTRGGRPYAWLCLDSHDNEPRHLFEHVLASCGERLLSGGTAAIEAQVEAGADVRTVCVRELGEALTAAPPAGAVLVLDDYHEVSTQESHDLVMDLLLALAGSVSVLITSRTRPPLRMARRLSAGELSLIRSSDLALSLPELRVLLNDHHGLELVDEELEIVHRRTHGWPAGAGLLLRTLELGTVGFNPLAALASLSQGQMVNYMVEEVLTSVDPEQARFMLFTSVVDSINGPLATALTLDADAPKRLIRLEEDGQFVMSDGKAGGWVRIHDLVRASQQVALEKRHPEMVMTLHQRASDWMNDNGLIEDAIAHAVRAQDSGRISALLVRHGLALAMQRRLFTVRRALDALGSDPDGLTPFGQALDLVLQLLEGAHHYVVAASAWELHERHTESPEVQLVTSILVVSPLTGEVSRALAAGREAIKRFGHLPGFMGRIAPGMAGSLMFAGYLAEARAMVEPLISTAGLAARIYAHTYLARADVAEEDPRGAEWHARRALELLDELGAVTSGDIAWVRAPLCDALRIAGKLSEARDQLQLGLEAERIRPGSIIHGTLLLSDAELALAERRRDRARHSAARAREIFSGFPDPGAAIWGRLDALDVAVSARADDGMLGSQPTEAELRVLTQLAVTSHRAAIANTLFLSEATVKSHLRRLYRRLGVRDRAAALAAARERGLLP